MKTKLLFLISITLFFGSNKMINAQCIFSSGSEGYIIGVTGHVIGQSITAECNGYLEYIQLLYAGTETDTLMGDTLRLYNGSSVETAVYEQVFGDIIVEEGDSIRIYLSNVFEVTNGEQYTFETLTSVEVKAQSQDYYGGGNLFYDGTGFAGYDMDFTVSISDTPPEIYGCAFSSGSEGYIIGVTGHVIGQSITAECNGYLEYIQLLYAGTETDTLMGDTLRLYNGSSVETAVYEQVFGDIIVEEGDSIRIYLSNVFEVTNGEQYTFETLTSVEVKAQSQDYYGGGNLFYDGTGFAGYDMDFTVSISDTPPEIYGCAFSSGSEGYIIGVTGHVIGQSITAECNGYLEYIQLLYAGTETDTLMGDTLRLYNGSSVETAVYEQVFGDVIIEEGSSIRIYLSDIFEIINGEQYTFEILTSVEVKAQSQDYYGGGNLFYDGTGFASYDMDFTVSISDIPPIPAYTLTCVENQTKTTDVGMCYYAVLSTEFDPTVTSSQVSSTTLTNDFNNEATLAGASIPLGITTITWKIFDNEGNVAFCSFDVTVNDEEAPEVVCIEDISKTADDGQNYYTVIGDEFDPVSISDNCGVMSMVNDLNDGATLDGAQVSNGTTITWTATDNSGNTAQCSFQVDVTTDIIDKIARLLVVYPNPVNDYLVIDVGKYQFNNAFTVQITDMLGKIKTFPNIVENESGYAIDVRNLENGIYFLSINDGEIQITRKFLKN